jgi:hypothetical protein
MAINPSAEYPASQIDTSDPTGYPQGAAQNITAPGDGTGTPLDKKWLNDVWGFLQSLLSAVGEAPSGTPDKVGASQYLDAARSVPGLWAPVVYLTPQDITSGDPVTSPVSIADLAAVKGRAVTVYDGAGENETRGRQYTIKTLAAHRVDIGDPTWNPSGYDVVAGASEPGDFVAICDQQGGTFTVLHTWETSTDTQVFSWVKRGDQITLRALDTAHLVAPASPLAPWTMEVTSGETPPGFFAGGISTPLMTSETSATQMVMLQPFSASPTVIRVVQTFRLGGLITSLSNDSDRCIPEGVTAVMDVRVI